MLVARLASRNLRVHIKLHTSIQILYPKNLRVFKGGLCEPFLMKSIFVPREAELTCRASESHYSLKTWSGKESRYADTLTVRWELLIEL
jgi:hypothetical protein